jgi:catechol 2,3-dioxygenase-like lactoylglutathione lyase family enzyme
MPPLLPYFGPIVQNAFVVRDLEAAVEYWSAKIGVGPFYLLDHISYGAVYFRGAPLAIDMSVAIAQWGDVQIELIVQHDGTASIYTEFLARHGEGLQHLGVMTASLDEHLERLRPLGIEPVQWGATANGMRFAYVNTDRHAGGMIELIETGPAVEAFFAKVRRAGTDWDGSRPLRRL